MRAALAAAAITAAACSPQISSGGGSLGEVGLPPDEPVSTSDHDDLLAQPTTTTTTTLPPPTTWHVHLAGVSGAVDWAWWDAVARCESGGDPNAYNPAGPYFGRLQWLLSTWADAGGQGHPRDASREYEYSRAQYWASVTDWRTQWPTCGYVAHHELGRGPR